MAAFVHILHTFACLLTGIFGRIRCPKGNTVSGRRWSAAEPTERDAIKGCRGPGGADRDDFSRWQDGYGYGPILQGSTPLGLGTFCVLPLDPQVKPAAIHGRSLQDRSLLRLR